MADMLAIHACESRGQALMSPKEQHATTRFFLDLEGNHATISDEDGVEASDVKFIIMEIKSAIKEMEDKSLIDPAEGWKIAIRNEEGFVIMRIPITNGSVA